MFSKFSFIVFFIAAVFFAKMIAVDFLLKKCYDDISMSLIDLKETNEMQDDESENDNEDFKKYELAWSSFHHLKNNIVLKLQQDKKISSRLCFYKNPFASIELSPPINYFIA